MAYPLSHRVLEVRVTMDDVRQFTWQHNDRFRFLADGPNNLAHGSHQGVRLL